MPPSSNDKIIADAVQDFSRGLHSDLPLRHFGEFHDQEELKKVVEQQKEKVLRIVIAKVWTRDKEEIFSLLMKVIDRIKKGVIAEWQAQNSEHRVKSLSLLQKWVDMICEDFNTALDYQLLINPDMEIESLKNYVQRRKQVAISCFENIWKPGTAQMQEERKSKLEKQLQFLEEEVFEKRQRILESKSVDEGNRLLGEVRTILLERSRQLKCYVDKHQDQVARDTLRSMVEEMRDYILHGKGSALRESHEENFNKLVEVAEEEIKFWSEVPKGKMTAEDVVEYAKRFDEKIRSCCFDNASDNQQEMQQDMNTRDPDPTEDPRRRTTYMQGILNEFMEGHGDSLDLEQNEAESLTGESDVNGDNDGNTNSNGGVEPEPSTGGKKGKLQHRSGRGFKRLVKETDSDDPTTIRGSTGPEVPPSKKMRSGRDIQRRSSRLKKPLANSVPVQTTFLARRQNPRKKKILHNLGLTEKIRDDVDEFPHSNCIDDDSIQGSNIMSTDVSESPSSLTSSTPSLRKNKKGNEDHLYRSRQMRTRSNYVVSRSTTRNSPLAFSGHADLRSVSTKSKGSKSVRAWKLCQGDDKVCPKNITILKGDNPEYLCTVCERKFSKKKYLNYHGEFCGMVKSKSFICDECGKGFHVKQNRDMHKRVHTGEKPFQCPECEEQFKSKWNLQRHIRCHVQNENPYICKPCNLTFVSPHGLHEHSLNHEGKFRFTCSYCNKRFNRMAKLRIHVISHADERPFKCSKCEAAFGKMEVLTPHIEQMHCQQKKMARKLAYDACVAYLLEETKDDSCRDIPVKRINAAVVNHVIKKANLRLPRDISLLGIGPHTKTN